MDLKYVLPFTPAAARAVARSVGAGRPYPKLCDVGLCAGRASYHRAGCAHEGAAAPRKGDGR